MSVQEWGDRLHDFADVTAAIVWLDRVISVDTAVMPLAGAMATSTWVLLLSAAD